MNMKELRYELTKKETEVRGLLESDKVSDAKEMMEEVRGIKEKLVVAEELEQKEIQNLENREGDKVMEKSIEVKVDESRAFVQAIRGIATAEERALLSGGSNGEGFVVPKDLNTEINELKRQYKSAVDLVGVYPTGTASGNLVVEDLSTMKELVVMSEMTDMDKSDQPKFRSVEYTVKDYGAILPISNTLLQDEDADLMGYVGGWFAKKAVRTENTKIFKAITDDSTAKDVKDYKELKSIINKELDPMIAGSSVIVTNQDGFDKLDNEVDKNDRPILQPNPTDPTQKMFGGKVVHVFSNAELPSTGLTTAQKSPLFVGDLAEAVRFVDRGVYEVSTSSDAGFANNSTMVRCIERFDAVKVDKDAIVVCNLATPTK